jgi:hypothetical protein
MLIIGGPRRFSLAFDNGRRGAQVAEKKLATWPAAASRRSICGRRALTRHLPVADLVDSPELRGGDAS